MKRKAVVVEELIDAPVEKVWQAITDKDKMKKWYFALEEFKPQVGFEFQFYGEGHKGERYLHLCRITEVVLNRKLQYTWAYEKMEGDSLVTFELFAKDNKTKVRVTHEGMESFPQGNPDFAIESFAEGWNQIIRSSLKKFIENEKV